MPLYFLLVTTRPFAEQQSEFHRWYDQVHLPEVLRVPGFIHAQRFQTEPTSLATPSEPSVFVAIYSIVTDDIASTILTFDQARRTMQSTHSLDPASVSFQLLRCLTVF